MRKLIVKQLPYELTPVAGLARVGHLVKAVQPVFARLDAALPIKGGVANSDIVRSYVGCWCRARATSTRSRTSEAKRSSSRRWAGLLPSSPTLRQRMDAKASALFDLVPPMTEKLPAGQRADYGVLACGWLPLDVDTFAMDNGGTAKEGVGRTYVGVDGYCPLAAYLG